jgi:hypothetical protein
MAKQAMLEVVNNTIEDNDKEFGDGFINGYLYYYDTNHRLSRPISCQTVYTFMMDNLHDEQKAGRWNAGFVFGWTAAFSENNPEYFFTSIVIPEANTEPLPVITVKER